MTGRAKKAPIHRGAALPDWLAALIDANDGELTKERLRALVRRLTPAQIAELDMLLGIAPPERLEQYIYRVSPSFVKARWLDEVIDALQRLVDGELLRLIIEAPPRHGKSFIVSEHLPSYYLDRFPWRWCGIASHTSSLAVGFSRKARTNYLRGGGRLFPGSRTVQKWQTSEGGGLWARGFDSGITGEGSGLLVIDDPVKSRKAIKQPEARRELMETYQDVLYTRLESDGAIVLMATRWHQDDLTGQLIRREVDQTELSEGWTLISRSARKPEVDKMARKIPESIRVIPDTREIGEALAPERGFNLDRLKRIERVVGPSTWESLFQQNPRPRDGAMFKWDDFKKVKATHTEGVRVRYWDLAHSEGEGDYTAGTLLSINWDAPIPIIIEHAVKRQYKSGRRDAFILEMAKRDAAIHGADGFVIWIERAGKERTAALVAKLGGYIVHTETAAGKGDKELRADPLASQVQVGNVALLEGGWNDEFLEGVCAFPNGDHDDDADSAAGAFNRAHDISLGLDVNEEAEPWDLV